MSWTVDELVASGALRERCNEAIARIECSEDGHRHSLEEWSSNGNQCVICGKNKPRYCCGRCDGVFDAPVASGEHLCRSIDVFNSQKRITFEDKLPLKPSPKPAPPKPAPPKPKPIPPKLRPVPPPAPRPYPPSPPPRPPSRSLKPVLIVVTALIVGGVWAYRGGHFFDGKSISAKSNQTSADTTNRSPTRAINPAGKTKNSAAPPPRDLRGQQAFAEAQRAVDSALIAIMASKPEDFWRAIKALDNLQKPSSGQRIPARALNKEGLKAFRAGNYAFAAVKWRKARELDSTDVEVANNLAYVALKQKSYDHAIEMLIVTLSLAPRRSGAWGTLGETLARVERPNEALASYKANYIFSNDRTLTLKSWKKIKKHEKFSPVGKALDAALTATGGKNPMPGWLGTSGQ